DGASCAASRARSLQFDAFSRTGRGNYFDFFFQAEDGIRDRNVTGVQTCALPILTVQTAQVAGQQVADGVVGAQQRRGTAAEVARSEERRVGKECRGGWWRGP